MNDKPNNEWPAGAARQQSVFLFNAEAQLPHNPAAETAILGAIMRTNDHYHYVASKLTKEDFYRPLNAEIYEQISKLMNDGRRADYVSLVPHLRGRKIGVVDIEQYVMDLVAVSADTVEELVGYVKEVQRYAAQRDLLIAARDLGNELAIGAADLTKVQADFSARLERAAERSDSDDTEPLPLMRQAGQAEPYPVEALGPLAEVAWAIGELTQAPMAAGAQSLLAVASTVAQAHVSVVLPIAGAPKPASLFTLSVLASGERKSAADALATKPIRVHEAALRDEHREAMKAFNVADAAWRAEHTRIVRDKDMSQQERVGNLNALGAAPQRPLDPLVICPEPTFEGLVKLFLTGQPSLAIISSEAGQFVGGHAMSEDHRLKTGAGLSSMWDAEPLTKVRSLEGATAMIGRRLAISLMMQPAVAERLYGDGVLIDQGLMSRFLPVAPSSAMGTRFWREPAPRALHVMEKYNGMLGERLKLKPRIKDGSRQELVPRGLRLEHDARIVWATFVDEIERQLGPAGRLRPVSGFAAKLPEHAARIACVLTFIEMPGAETINAGMMTNGVTLARHYAGEALRLMGVAAVDPETMQAEILRDWLKTQWTETFVSHRAIVRRGPNQLRSSATIKRLVKILVDHRWLAPPIFAQVEGKPCREAFKVQRG